MNYELFRAINDLHEGTLFDPVMRFVASSLVFGAFVVVAVLCLVRAREGAWRPVLATGAGLGLTYLISLALAAAHPEKRPFQTHRVHLLLAHAPGQAFPSDHATAAFGIALAVLVFLSWRWGVGLFLVALVIGFARVYVGIHYPGDIAGGLVAAVLGVGAAALVDHSIRRARPAGRSGTLSMGSVGA